MLVLVGGMSWDPVHSARIQQNLDCHDDSTSGVMICFIHFRLRALTKIHFQAEKHRFVGGAYSSLSLWKHCQAFQSHYLEPI